MASRNQPRYNAYRPSQQRRKASKPTHSSTQPQSPPINDSVRFQPYELKVKPKPFEYRPPLTCCPVAIYCQEKRLPVSHAIGCKNVIKSTSDAEGV